MNRQPALQFDKAAKPVDEKSAFKAHFRLLKDEMRRLANTLPKDTGDPTHLNPIEEGLKQALKTFLTSMDYQLALGNFEILLEEKSGDYKYRADGSVNWHHEFLPIFELLTMASQGEKNGGFDIDDLMEYGGLEMLICTHLRHDSKEDFKELHQIREEQYTILSSLDFIPTKYQGTFFIDRLIDNIDLISQKRIEKGPNKGAKESVFEYVSRIINSENSNPIILLCKMGDIGNNLSTLLRSIKFTPDKRLKTCNDREDMFGPRQGFTEEAAERWPEFKSAIKTLDCSMGVLLYPHFRYLANVDRHYKEPTQGRVGIGKYLKSALRLDIPEPYNKIHIGFKRMQTSVSIEDAEKHGRLVEFMDDIIKPALQKYAPAFHYLFPANDNNKAHALPKTGTYVPNGP